MKLRRFISIFLLAFLANLLWEHAHAVLYVHYQGGAISELVLLHATLVDALLISGSIFLTRILPQRLRLPLLSVVLLVIAVGIEWWALATHRWAYTSLMPIVPLLGVGVSPMVQLVMTAWFTLWLTRKDSTL